MSKEDFSKTRAVPVEHNAAEMPGCPASALLLGKEPILRSQSLRKGEHTTTPRGPRGPGGGPCPSRRFGRTNRSLRGAGAVPGVGRGRGGAATSAQRARGPGAARAEGSACGGTSPGHG